MIRFEQVGKRYPNGHMGLDGVSFHIHRGEMVFITGHSGAGKSTLLKLIMCMERPSSGQVHIGGQNLRDLGSDDIPYLRRQIGVVFQNHQLLFDRTVFDNVALPLVINGTPNDEVGRRVRAALDKVGLLNKEKSYPIALSGGEQQRVGIARAVVHKPALLLADEPTGNLDPALSAEIMKLFEDFNRVGVTVLIASHDLPLIAQLDHRMLTLDQGHLVTDGEQA
ncbi:MAG: cell division ATP-binding protein FtsE [Pseudomonadaceae bacterium]|nr:MAG: cell division ATP-binding protein FtsE [Pseudomonadaceae bacterium]